MSGSCKLRDPVEVSVEGVESEAVLQRQRSDPDVVDRDRGTLAHQLELQLSVEVRGLLVAAKNADAGGVEELRERGLVRSAIRPFAEPEPQLGQHRDRQPRYSSACRTSLTVCSWPSMKAR